MAVKRARTEARQYDRSKVVRSTRSKGRELWSLLPAEMRNKIYEEVLKDDSELVDGPYNFRTIRRRRSWRTPRPPLLSVSKQIRYEMLRMFYNLKHFEIKVVVKDLNLANDWLSCVTSSLAGRPDANTQLPRIYVDLTFTDLKWKHVPGMLPLAQLVHTHGNAFCLNMVQGTLGYTHLDEAMKEVADLGQRAADEGWHSEWLRIKFDEWWEGIPSTDYLKREVLFKRRMERQRKKCAMNMKVKTTEKTAPQQAPRLNKRPLRASRKQVSYVFQD